MPLVVITALFAMSLLAAWVLFKILQSTATVNKPEYQLGGAAAGFVVILGILSLTYIQVNSRLADDRLKKAQDKIADLQRSADAGAACLKMENTEVTYAGTVSPALQEAYVIFGVTEAKLQQDGKFAIKVHQVTPVTPSALPFIYVIGPNAHAPYKQVFPADDPANLTIAH